MEGLTICSTRRAAPVPFFPHEIIEQILLKLPAISLLQFKCVCKSWRDLISTHEFAIQNLIETSERFRRLGVLESKILREGRISLYSLATQASSLAEEAEEETICVPAANKFASAKILGSCNGMLLICLENVKGSNLNPRKFLLWNPTIREFKMIPPCDFRSSCRSLVSGFGYNSSIDNYKAVVVFYERKSDLVCGYVYNLRTNSWKRLENFYFPYKCAKLLYNHRDIYLPNEIGTTLVNGAPHWVTLSVSVSVFGVNKIIYFDLEDEKFKEFQSPPPSAGTFKTFLSIYEDCICENRLRREDSYIEFTLEVWIMKKYGVKESWIKLLNLPFGSRFSLMSNIRPLAVSKNGEEVIMVTDWINIISFKPRTGEIKVTLFWEGEVMKVSLRVDKGDVVASYEESLVSPNRFTRTCSEDGKY